MKATVVGIYGAYYQVRPEVTDQENKNPVILAKPRGKLRLGKKNHAYGEPKERHLLTIGDVVEIEQENDRHDANIIRLYPRENSFQRATIYQKQTLGANLTAIVIILSVDLPTFNSGLLARLLVETALSKIPPVLILNKMDFLEKSRKPEYQQTLEIVEYFKQKQNFKVYYETFCTGISTLLRSDITSGRYLVFGESGVGKSTFINQMAGKKIQATDLQEINLKGRHITTNPVLYEMAGGIELIDVPGIREFGLMHRSKHEISAGFPEFRDMVCRYDNCLHLEEPDCGVKSSMENNTLPKFRYEQYRNIMGSMLEHWKPRRGDLRNFNA